jgi:hypothetical protein
MVSVYWSNLLNVFGYLTIILIVCLTTDTIALFCSVLFRKTTLAMMTAYFVIVVLFTFPLAVTYFAATFFPDTAVTKFVDQAAFTSPFAAAFSLPIDPSMPNYKPGAVQWPFFASFVGFYVLFNVALLAVMPWLFNLRWRND